MAHSGSEANRPEAFASGFLAGMAVGVATGFLLAPRSGREARRLVKHASQSVPEFTENLTVKTRWQTKRISKSFLQRWDATLIRFQDAIIAGLEASQQDVEQVMNEPSSHGPETGLSTPAPGNSLNNAEK